jgi:hypothetical protein
MKRLVMASLLMLLATSVYAARLAPPPATWTLARTECWRTSEKAGQCAIGLFGSFPTKEGCVAANGGRESAETTRQDGLFVTQGCMIKLLGDF